MALLTHYLPIWLLILTCQHSLITGLITTTWKSSLPRALMGNLTEIRNHQSPPPPGNQKQKRERCDWQERCESNCDTAAEAKALMVVLSSKTTFVLVELSESKWRAKKHATPVCDLEKKYHNVYEWDGTIITNDDWEDYGDAIVPPWQELMIW